MSFLATRLCGEGGKWHDPLCLTTVEFKTVLSEVSYIYINKVFVNKYTYVIINMIILLAIKLG